MAQEPAAVGVAVQVSAWPGRPRATRHAIVRYPLESRVRRRAKGREWGLRERRASGSRSSHGLGLAEQQLALARAARAPAGTRRASLAAAAWPRAECFSQRYANLLAFAVMCPTEAISRAGAGAAAEERGACRASSLRDRPSGRPASQRAAAAARSRRLPSRSERGTGLAQRPPPPTTSPPLPMALATPPMAIAYATATTTSAGISGEEEWR